MLLSACWPAPGFDAGRTGHNPFEDRISPDTVDDLHQIWTAATDGGDVAGPAEEPVVSNQAVHVSAGRALYALSKSTGARLWQKVTDAPSPVGVMGQAVADGDRVLVGHGFPNLGGNWVTEAVDAATGAPLAEVGAGLVDGLRGSTLLTRRQGFGTGTPVAISLTVTDLDQPGSGWSGTIGVVAALGGEPIPPPLTLGPNFAFQSGHGTLLEPGGPLTNGNGIRAFAVSGAAGCPPPAGTLRCPDWSTPLDGTSSVSPVLGEALYVGTNAGTMYALDPATGAIQWSTSVGAAISAPAAVADGTVFVPTADGRLVALDAATGGRSWTASTGVELGVQPAVAGGVVFTGSDDGALHAFAAAGCGSATCEPLWTASTGSSAGSGGPAVSGGQLYVGTADGQVIAYGLP